MVQTINGKAPHAAQMVATAPAVLQIAKNARHSMQNNALVRNFKPAPMTINGKKLKHVMVDAQMPNVNHTARLDIVPFTIHKEMST